MRRLVPLAVLASSAVALHAQNVPKRPFLSDGDTNSAGDYYAFGLSVLDRDPRKASDAFYWASRIDPTWAKPLYARRIALLLDADDRFVIGYLEGVRSFTHSKQAQRIDSLETRARMLSPFLERDLEENLLRRLVLALYNDTHVGGLTQPGDRQEFEFYMERYFRVDAPPSLRAVLAVAEHNFPKAIDLYRDALQRQRSGAAEIHESLANIFFFIGKGDSARVELGAALHILRQEDKKDFVYLYESKAALEHGVGLVSEQLGQLDSAREAYGRALQEDLSYYPSHMRLGLLAFGAADTATALSELDLAVQIQADDPWLLTIYGALLAEAKRYPEAETQLRKAIAVEPFYAMSYFVLGRIADFTNRPSDAIVHYRSYLAHVHAREPRAATVRQRLIELTASVSHQ